MRVRVALDTNELYFLGSKHGVFSPERASVIPLGVWSPCFSCGSLNQSSR